MIRIKICGLTRTEDALLAINTGCEYLGFILSESPRRITPAQAQELIQTVPATAEHVGVFVNEEESFIRAAVRQAQLSMIQLHGDETPEFCRLFNLPVIKALKVKDEGIFKIIPAYDTEYILLEPYVPGKYGGTGKTIDWDLAAEIIKTFPDKKFFLAGGLNPDNAETAARRIMPYAPYAMDASSGLEAYPGIKDPEKIKQFIKVVKSL